MFSPQTQADRRRSYHFDTRASSSTTPLCPACLPFGRGTGGAARGVVRRPLVSGPIGFIALVALVTFLGLGLLYAYRSQTPAVPTVPMTQALAAIQDGQVDQILLENDRATLTLYNGTREQTNVGSRDVLLQAVTEYNRAHPAKDIQIRYDDRYPFGQTLFRRPSITPTARPPHRAHRACGVRPCARSCTRSVRASGAPRRPPRPRCDHRGRVPAREAQDPRLTTSTRLRSQLATSSFHVSKSQFAISNALVTAHRPQRNGRAVIVR